MVKDILLLGNPKLYETSQPVKQADLTGLKEVVNDLHDTLIGFRERYGAGRAIAAPQIGVMKHLLYMFIDKPVVFINPELRDMSAEMMLVWDDQLGSNLSRLMRITRSTVRLYQTATDFQMGPDSSNLITQTFSSITGNQDVSIDDGYDQETTVFIRANQGAPFTALSITNEAESGERG